VPPTKGKDKRILGLHDLLPEIPFFRSLTSAICNPKSSRGDAPDHNGGPERARKRSLGRKRGDRANTGYFKKSLLVAEQSNGGLEHCFSWLTIKPRLIAKCGNTAATGT